MKSRLVYSNAHKKIEREIANILNAHEEFLTGTTATSPRAAGDAIQEILADEFQSILGDWCKEYSQHFARRAMADRLPPVSCPLSL